MPLPHCQTSFPSQKFRAFPLLMSLAGSSDGCHPSLDGKRGGASSDDRLDGMRGGASSDDRLDGKRGGTSSDRLDGIRGGASSDDRLDGKRGGTSSDRLDGTRGEISETSGDFAAAPRGALPSVGASVGEPRPAGKSVFAPIHMEPDRGGPLK